MLCFFQVIPSLSDKIQGFIFLFFSPFFSNRSSGSLTSPQVVLSVKKVLQIEKSRKLQKQVKSECGSRGELGVARRRKLALQVFDDVERKTADQRDGRHLPEERPSRDEGQVKVFVEEGERGQVTPEAEELCDHHEPVPRPDGERHHQKLGQDERCEGDGDHVHELRLEQHQSAVHEDATLIHADQNPNEEGFKG